MTAKLDFRKLSSIVVLAVPVVAYAQASAAPDAGTLLQQIERGTRPTLPAPAEPVLIQPPEMTPKQGMVVTVTRFRFQGNRLLDEARLAVAVAPWLNRPLSFQDLQNAVSAVAEAYREAGWVVRAYLPKQEIDSGVVTIQVVEAVLGKVVIQGTEGTRISKAQVEDILTSNQKHGYPVNADKVDRALLLIGDLPGVVVKGHLKAGEQIGETDLVADLEPQSLFVGDVTADNFGSHSTGESRISGAMYINSPLRLGDQMALNLIHSEGSDYARAAWSLPIGNSGLRSGINFSNLKYRLVNYPVGIADSANINGMSTVVGANATYPIVRSRLQNLYLNVEYNKKNFYNESLGTSTSEYRVNTTSIGLIANRSDSFFGGGQTNASVSLQNGNLDLSGSANQASDALGPNANGDYRILHYSFSRLQALTGKMSAYVSWAGQSASKNLDTSERFYLGGAYGVRAYPSSEAGGSDGDLVNLELRYNLPRDAGLTAFYDWGRVKVNHDNNFNGAALNNELMLRGAGLSLSWAAPSKLFFRLTWARRIGENPNPTLSGADQDGTRVLDRFWLQANKSF